MYKLSLKNHLRSIQKKNNIGSAATPVKQIPTTHKSQVLWKAQVPAEKDVLNCPSAEDVYSNLSDAETVHNQEEIFNEDDRSESDATIYD